MGEWRHFGAGLDLAASHECDLSIAGIDLRPRHDASTHAVRDDLVDLIEGEILPRLMLVHRSAHPVAVRPPARLADTDRLRELCTRLLDPSDADLAAYTLALLKEGRNLETLLLDLLVPAARRLGELWESDECDFVDVTIGMGRLQTIARTLCARLEETHAAGGRNVLLMPCPGETHTFSLAVVGSFFRDEGWSVTTAGTDTRFDAVDLVEQEWFDVIGLTVSCEILLPAMARAVARLREASCNRSVRILVGGPLFDRRPELVRIVGADATATDGRRAPYVAAGLLDMRARAC